MTLSGVIYGATIAILVGGFFGIAIWSSQMKSWKKVLVQLLLCLVFFCIAGFGMSAEETSFNNGYCIRCGTHYQAIQHQSTQICVQLC